MSTSIIAETERLILRRFVESDVEDFYVLGSDPQIIRYTHDPGGGFDSVEDAARVLREYPLADYARYGYGRWAVVDRESDRVIGFAGPKYLPEMKETDLGYRLMPAFWGQGLATEAARASIDHYFAELRGQKLVAYVLPENKASDRVLQKVGMRLVGVVDYEGIEANKYECQAPA